MMGPAYCISLQDFIGEISDSIRGAAGRLRTEGSTGEQPASADLALIRVRVRFSTRMKYRRRWFRQGERAGEVYLNFHPKESANMNGELYFNGDGELLKPFAEKQKGAGSEWD